MMSLGMKVSLDISFLTQEVPDVIYHFCNFVSVYTLHRKAMLLLIPPATAELPVITRFYIVYLGSIPVLI